MQNTYLPRIRAVARRVAPLYWVVGLARYVIYRFKLRIEDEKYRLEPSRSLPPPRLRHRVHGAFDKSVYLNAGQVISASIYDAWRRHASLRSPEVLDFGCGPGRVLVPMGQSLPEARLFGTDIDSDSIDWAKSNLQGIARFERNSPIPPTRYGDGAFDLIYSVSVFTHLDEDSQFAWLRELRRILKETGRLIVSVHGTFATRSCTPSELRTLADHGFAFRTDRRGLFKLDGLPDFYQTTFHTREYVMRAWSEWFEILEYVEGGLAGHQDLIVLKPRPASR